MAKEKKTDIREKIILSALRLAEEQGWERITLSEIAAAADIELAELRDVFEDKTDILAGFGRMIDKTVLANVGKVSDEESVRDRLFDVLMDRFEALNEYRGGVIAVVEGVKLDPKQALIGLPHLCRSMNWMLEAAGVSTAGLQGAVKLSGVTALYLKAVRIWVKDESADLAKVMACLDQDLARVESWVGRLGLG